MSKRGFWKRLVLHRRFSLVYTVKQDRFKTYFWIRRGFASAAKRLIRKGNFAEKYLAGVAELGFIEKFVGGIDIFLKPSLETKPSKRSKKDPNWITLGQMDPEDVARGIYQIEAYFPGGTEGEVIMDEFPKVLLHELAHIWHYRDGLIHAIARKSKKTFRKLAKKEATSGTLRRDILEDSKGFYLSMLLILEKGKQMVYYEGLAEFCSYFHENSYSFDDLRNLAEEKALEVEKLYLKLFNIFVDILVALIKRKSIDPYVDMIAEVRATCKSLLSYRVGPAVIATLYHNGGYTLEDLSVMKPNKVIKEYERVAKRMGYSVLVGLRRGSSGIVNYGEMVYKLNQARKTVDLRFR